MPGEKVSNELAARREVIARCERTMREAEADVGPSWQTEKAIHDLRLWLKVLKQQTAELEKLAAHRR